MGLPGLPNFRAWHIINTDNFEEIEGDFEAVGVTRNVTTSYSQKTTLNRQDPITQFLHGNADTLTFQGRAFAHDALLGDATEKLTKLIEWTKRDPDLGRPPVVLFFVGDADPIYGDFFSIIESISDITYDSPTVTGAVRGVSFTVNLRQFTEFELETGPAPETRSHNAKQGEYMELIAEAEYGNPMMGDIIRKRHPDLQLLRTGNVVGLPSFEAIRRTKVVPTSIQLQGLTKSKASPQKDLRDHHLDRLNRIGRSVVVPEGL
jgi:hypothetical protein